MSALEWFWQSWNQKPYWCITYIKLLHRICLVSAFGRSHKSQQRQGGGQGCGHGWSLPFAQEIQHTAGRTSNDLFKSGLKFWNFSFKRLPFLPYRKVLLDKTRLFLLFKENKKAQLFQQMALAKFFLKINGSWKEMSSHFQYTEQDLLWWPAETAVKVLFIRC